VFIKVFNLTFMHPEYFWKYIDMNKDKFIIFPKRYENEIQWTYDTEAASKMPPLGTEVEIKDIEWKSKKNVFLEEITLHILLSIFILISIRCMNFYLEYTLCNLKFLKIYWVKMFNILFNILKNCLL